MAGCLKCGDTGITVLGEVCTCGAKRDFALPLCLNVPVQYQGVRFAIEFIDEELRYTYGEFMRKLLVDCTEHLGQFHKNYIICAPPNSGKTIWAYTVYGLLFAKGVQVPEIMDLMQVREIFLDYYNKDQQELERLSTAPLAVIKLPWDLPNRFPETISTIVERRVRANGSTIFLFDGTQQELLARDTFGKLKLLSGDGSYNSVCIKSWWKGGDKNDA